MRMHPLLVVLFWLLTLGIFSIRVNYRSGSSLNLVGWPEALRSLWQK